MTAARIGLFVLDRSQELGAAIAAHLGVAMERHDEHTFADGEHKARPLEGLRDKDVYVLYSLFSEPGLGAGEKLLRLLFFTGALRDAGAERITVLTPYLCYARQDRRTRPYDPLTHLYTARLVEAAGVDAILTVDVHNPAAFQNAFRCVSHHLEAGPLFLEHFAYLLGHEEAAVISPDLGGMKRAARFRAALAARLGKPVGSGFVEKRRADGQVSGFLHGTDIQGRIAILYDDLISTGTTLARAAEACREAGAAAVHGAATHGLFAGEAGRVLAEAPLESVVVTNTVVPPPPAAGTLGSRLHVLSAAPLLAEAIHRLHTEGAMSEPAP